MEIVRVKQKIRLRIVLCVMALLTIFGCTKEQFYTADDYVGTYSVSVINRTRIGAETMTDSGSGKIAIYKISSSRVQVVGYIDTYAEIKGNMIYFEPTSYSSSSYQMQMSFNSGQLNGNVLTFSTVSSGHYYYNGKSVPCSIETDWTAIKIDE